MRRRITVSTTILGVMVVGMAHAEKPKKEMTLFRSDRRYLAGVYRDTWASLAHFVDAPTGLPWDSSQRPSLTSTSDVGMYVAACAVAGKTGLLPVEKARGRIETVLSSLEKWPRFGGGFPVTWARIPSLESAENTFSTVDHLASLVGGLLVVKTLVPELGARVDKILTPMAWGDLLDPERYLFRGGWRMKENTFAVDQPGWKWHYGSLAAETRFAYVWALGTGQIPLDVWSVLDRHPESKYGFTYWAPGWEGGLAMAMGTGVFIDERKTPLGRSAAELAWVQIQHAERVSAPVWGWTFCQSADGERFLDWGKLVDGTVSPAAPVLASLYYPRRCVAALRAMEYAGVRAPHRVGQRELKGGFRDSFDWRSGTVSNAYTAANQGLIFLTLANLLHDGVVWKAVAAHAPIQRALRELSDYQGPTVEAEALYRERDARVPPLDKKKLKRS